MIIETRHPQKNETRNHHRFVKFIPHALCTVFKDRKPVPFVPFQQVDQNLQTYTVIYLREE